MALTSIAASFSLNESNCKGPSMPFSDCKNLFLLQQQRRSDLSWNIKISLHFPSLRSTEQGLTYHFREQLAVVDAGGSPGTEQVEPALFPIANSQHRQVDVAS